MKYIWLFIVCLSFVACKKSQQDVVAGVSATENGKVWTTTNTSTGFKPLATKDTLYIIAHNGSETLDIQIKQRGVGTYKAGEYQAIDYSVIGGDGIYATYAISSADNNSLVITDYDEANHILKGSFNFTFRSTVTPPAVAPFNFSGSFNVTLSDTYLDLSPFFKAFH